MSPAPRKLHGLCTGLSQIWSPLSGVTGILNLPWMNWSDLKQGRENRRSVETVRVHAAVEKSINIAAARLLDSKRRSKAGRFAYDLRVPRSPIRPHPDTPTPPFVVVAPPRRAIRGSFSFNPAVVIVGPFPRRKNACQSAAGAPGKFIPIGFLHWSKVGRNSGGFIKMRDAVQSHDDCADTIEAQRVPEELL